MVKRKIKQKKEIVNNIIPTNVSNVDLDKIIEICYSYVEKLLLRIQNLENELELHKADIENLRDRIYDVEIQSSDYVL